MASETEIIVQFAVYFLCAICFVFVVGVACWRCISVSCSFAWPQLFVCTQIGRSTFLTPEFIVDVLRAFIALVQRMRLLVWFVPLDLIDDANSHRFFLRLHFLRFLSLLCRLARANAIQFDLRTR